MTQLKTIIPLSLFKKNTNEYLSLLELGEEALMLTIHGRGAFVVQGINSFMHLKELADLARHQSAMNEMFERMQQGQ